MARPTRRASGIKHVGLIKSKYCDAFSGDASSTSCQIKILPPYVQFHHSSLLVQYIPIEGEEVVISTHVSNHCRHPNVHFVAIVQVRNSEEVTEHLVLQTVDLPYGDAASVGTAWLPEHPDSYELLIIAVSDLENPCHTFSHYVFQFHCN
jgi:hypothetical protein